MTIITLCTANKHKAEEIKAKLEPLGIKVQTADEILDHIPDIIEDKNTFEGNAEKKAKEFYKLIKGPCLADDTGLCVDYLNGAPGVFSARYAGEEHDYNANNEKLLTELGNLEFSKRGAKFITVMVLIIDNKTKYIIKGEVKGKILTSRQGKDGFGYDPLFYVEEKNKTMAEMNMQEKNIISHRGKALDKLVKLLKKIDSFK